MAWLGEGLSSLSNLKGQLTSFTKEVLSDGIVNEIDDRSKDLEEANEKCSQLQELLNSKEVEISILRKQNSELQKAVVEFKAKPTESRNNGAQDEDAGVFFWDPPPASKGREAKAQGQNKLLQDQLEQATVRIRDLESELNRLQTLNSSNVKDNANFKEEGPSQKTELLRAKQDVMNRIIQIGEKSREVERNTKRLQQDELTLVSDFRRAISKLASPEQFHLIKSALLALDNENEQFDNGAEREKSDSEGFDNEGKLRRASDKSLKLDGNSREAELRQRIEQLEADNKNLTASIEELDSEHSEAIDRVLTLKEELQKKHQTLQDAYEHLYVDHNEALSKIETLRQHQQQSIEFQASSVKKSLDSAVQTSNLSKLDKQTEAVVIKEEKETEIDLKHDGDTDIAAETVKVENILKNAPLEPSNDNAGDSIFVAVARQFVDLKWKKETLERKLTEQSRELHESQEHRNSLQIDCEDLQANIESLLMQIQHLKSNLPSIPEASEERVASLETETESLQDEIRTLRKSNSDMSTELKAIKAAIKETGANVDIARIEDLLQKKPKKEEAKDPSEILQTTIDENTALRRRIDVLESELRVSLERCKGLDENIELIEELKLDLENARRELKIASSNNKRLENSLAILQETKNEVDADHEVLVREKEQLEADLKLLRESDLKRNDGEALAELRENLKKVTDEKNDLEYDIRNMRNELDHTLEDLEINKSENNKLALENERLSKENNKLMDQFSDTHNESLDKIELLNTEMTLLQQELEGCKDELENSERNLTHMKEKISDLDNEKIKIKDELDKVNHVQVENERLKRELEDISASNNFDNIAEELKHATSKLKEFEEKISTLESEKTVLQNDLMNALKVEDENRKVIEENQIKEKEIFKKNEEVARLGTELKISQNYISTLEDEHLLLKNKLNEIEEENENSKKEINALLLQQKVKTNEIQETENDILKELTIKYQNEIENRETTENENKRLKKELDKLLVQKCDVQVSTDDLTKDNAYQELHPSTDELTTLATQLSQKSKEIETLTATVAKDKESALMARETIENLSQLISSKDNEIIQINASFNALKNERDELIKLVQEKHNESHLYHSEIQRLTQLLKEQTANLQMVIGEKDISLASLQEKESELLWAQNELQVVKQRLQNVEETSNLEEKCGITEHTLLTQKVSVLEEKSKVMESAIIQDQSNIRYLQDQLTEAQNKEVIALKEVERLRNHLVDIEANYTEEALQTEEIQRTLQTKLMHAEEKLKNSSTMYTSASVRANQQVETLQQQLALIVQQRDDLQNKISTAEDKVLSYSASLTNLQLVLEQFQRDKEKDIQAATEKLRHQIQESSKKQDDLSSEITNLKEQLIEAKECLRAASRLTEQLEKKSERIEQLNQEVSRLTEFVNTADKKIREANKTSEGKVDKSLVKNLLLGYISSPLNDKSSVLRVFANVLDFDEVEREKSGLNSSSAKNSWFSSMINSSPSSSKDQEASLSSAFIKFLETESQPKPQLPALPISNSPISRPGHSRQHSSSSTQSTLLLSNVTLPTFPDFVPARNTGSILKEVLKDS